MTDETPTKATDPVSVIEYLPDGCALVRRSSGTEQLMMSDDVPEFLATQTESRPEYDRGYAAAKGDLQGELSILRDANRQMMEALDAINRRASPGPDRTFDDCSRDLCWCASEARMALA